MEVEEEEVEVSRAEEGGRLIWRAPGAGLQERRGTGGSSRCWPLSVVIWRREGNGVGWGEAGREGGEPGGVGTGAGGAPQGESGGAVGAAVLRATPQCGGRRRGGGSALRILLRGPLRNGSSAFRRIQALGGMDRPGPGPAPTRGGSAQRRSASSSAPHLGNILIRQKEEAQEPPLPISSALLFFHIHFFLAQRHTVAAYRFLESCSFFFFFSFPADPSESGREINRDTESQRGSERGKTERPPPFQLGSLHPSSGQEALLLLPLLPPHHPRLALAAGPSAFSDTVCRFLGALPAPQAPVCPPLPGTAEGRGEKLPARSSASKPRGTRALMPLGAGVGVCERVAHTAEPQAAVSAAPQACQTSGF